MDYTKPLLLHKDVVKPEWIDEYDHMNLSFYVWVCDQATYEFWELANERTALENRDGAEYAVVESHVNYIREVRLNDPLTVTTQLISYDKKRFRIYHELYQSDKGYLSATNELIALGFNLNERRTSEFRDPVQSMLDKIYRHHSLLDLPANAGRSISFIAPK